jgi:transposase InsO family protein
LTRRKADRPGGAKARQALSELSFGKDAVVTGADIDRNAARAEVFDYIERFYNLTRRHSAISYLSPIAFGCLAGSG